MKALIEKPPPLRKSLGVAFGLILSLTALLLLLLPPGWAPRCGLASWAGVPCPSCGVTRSLHLLAEGNLGGAFMTQPLFFIFSAAFTGWFFYTLAALAFKWPSVRIKLESRNEKLALLLLVGILISTNWIYLMLAHG